MGILWLLFILFFGIGFFGFGSGLAILPIIFQTVDEHGFLTHDEFARMVAISQALPGPVSINAISYNGYIVAGIPGSVVSVIAIVLPSFILVLLVMKFLERFKGSAQIDGVFSGIRPVTIGLIGAAAVMISENTLFFGSLISEGWAEKGLEYINPAPCIICAVVLVLVLKTKVSPFLLILLSALAGAFLIR